MNKQTASTLKKCGIQPHLLGYEYLGEAVEMVIEDRTNLHRATTKVLYPSIAKKFNSTPSRVERAIRHAIEVAFNNLTPDIIEELFGNSLDYRTAQPTNSHFIAAVAELIKYSNES